MTKYKTVAVFGSARDSIDEAFRKPIFETGALLAEKGITMVFGVGDYGLMGESFRGVRSKGGKVLGITIPSLFHKQCPDPSVFHEGEVQIVDTLHDRKHIMMESADALLIAPGGWGTLDEIASLGVHASSLGDRTVKPMIFLNFNGFWDPLKKQFEIMLKHGAINPEQLIFVDWANTPDEIFDALDRAQKRISK